MPKYNTIIFDLDGTLTDPKTGITKSVLYALSKFDIIEENLDYLEQFIGPPLLESFKKYYSFEELKARQAVEYYREYFSEFGIYENVVYSGISDLLEKLKNSGKQLIVATSKPTLYAERILKHFDLHKYFNRIVGSNLDGSRTSKDEIIQDILSVILNTKRQNIIIVGDREQDITVAHSNGIDSIAITYGYGSNEELKNANPTYIVSSVEDLGILLNQNE